MDSRLLITLEIDSNGNIATIDTTNYEDLLEGDIQNHVIIERAVDSNEEVTSYRITEIESD